MRSRRSNAFAVLCVWCAGFSGLAMGQDLDAFVPPTMKVFIEQAEEDFFDGDLESAHRRVDEAYDWIRANKNPIARAGGDHTVLEAMVAGLYAEIFHASGDSVKAEAKLRHAEKLVEIRRTIFVRNKRFAPFLWQYDAFLKCTRGDVNRPTPDFGISADAGLSESARQFFSDRGDATQAIRAYKASEAAMVHPFAKSDNDSIRLNRLRGKVLTNLAWVCILKAGPPKKNDLDDADSFLRQAEAAFASNPYWKQIVEGENFGLVPRAFKDIDARVVGGDKQALKRTFTQTIQDWLGMQLLRAEMTAFQEQEIDQDLVDNAERNYDRIVSFLKTQYNDDHPRVQSARLSRARWFLAASRAAEKKPGLRQSLLKDCVGELEEVGALGGNDMLQKQVIELSALLEMLKKPAKDGGLAGDERAARERRVAEVRQSVEAEVARRTRKRLDAGPAAVDKGEELEEAEARR